MIKIYFNAHRQKFCETFFYVCRVIRLGAPIEEQSVTNTQTAYQMS